MSRAEAIENRSKRLEPIKLDAAERDRRAGLRLVEKAAEQRVSPITHVDCRVFGHAWEPSEADRNPGIGWYMNVRCTRCTTVRSDIVNRHGVVERRRYAYPDNYKDSDKWGRTQWRMQFLRRLESVR